MDFKKEFIIYTAHTFNSSDVTQNVIEIDFGDEIKVLVDDIGRDVNVEKPQIWLHGVNMRTNAVGYIPGNCILFNRREHTEMPSIPLPNVDTFDLSNERLDSGEELGLAKYYWGNISRETVTELMRDQPNGAFLLRDSQDESSAEYTLNVKQDGINKLLRIYRENGKYGLLENVLNFNSVASLINHYRDQSLINDSRLLDMKLIKPIEKNVNDNHGNANVEYMKVTYQSKSREYYEMMKKINDKTEELSKYDDDIRNCNQALNAFQKILDVLVEHETKLDKSIEETYRSEKEQFIGNKPLMQDIIQRCKNDKTKKGEEIREITEKSRAIGVEIHLLRTDLKKVHTVIDNVRDSLMEFLTKEEIEGITPEYLER